MSEYINRCASKVFDITGHVPVTRVQEHLVAIRNPITMVTGLSPLAIIPAAVNYAVVNEDIQQAKPTVYEMYRNK